MLKSKIKYRLVVDNKKFFIKPSPKVIKFKNKNSSVLTDDDIKYLFMGLVNLIKSNTQKNMEVKYRKELSHYQNELECNALRIVKLEDQIRKLKERV